jgi:hypothetical protein
MSERPRSQREPAQVVARLWLIPHIPLDRSPAASCRCRSTFSRRVLGTDYLPDLSAS